MNSKIVCDLVKQHFCLEKESFDFFKREIEKPTIDEVYLDILNGSPDLRKRWEIDEKLYEEIDKGWKLFKHHFPILKRTMTITYENFRKNRILANKNVIKIQKVVTNFYLKDNALFGNEEFGTKNKELIKDGIRVKFENIGAVKLPNTKIEIVLSLNYADWFLCSTKESWSSCLNLGNENSYSFWTGLPGLIGDKNRALIYITDKKKKTYQGITVDRILSRSWVLLDDRNDLNIVKFYPDSYVRLRTINETTKLDLKFIGCDFVSKKEINFLYFDIGDKPSAFIYQDSTTFYNKKIIGRGGGFYFVTKNNPCYVGSEQDIFSCEGGLTYLIKNKKNLKNYKCYNLSTCRECGDTCREEDEYYFQGCYYCENCYNDLINSCDECGNDFYREDMHYPEDNYCYCENCYNEIFIECEDCGSEIKIDHSTFINNSYSVCNDCLTNYTLCDECDEYIDPDNILKHDNKYYCKECAKNKNIDYCKKCLSQKNLVSNLKGEYNCKKCIDLAEDHLQRRFNFEPDKLVKNLESRSRLSCHTSKTLTTDFYVCGRA